MADGSDSATRVRGGRGETKKQRHLLVTVREGNRLVTVHDRQEAERRLPTGTTDALDTDDAVEPEHVLMGFPDRLKELRRCQTMNGCLPRLPSRISTETRRLARAREKLGM